MSQNFYNMTILASTTGIQHS